MHQQPIPPTDTIVQYMPRKIFSIKPSLLETDGACIPISTFRLRYGLIRGVVDAEPILPLSACGSLDRAIKTCCHRKGLGCAKCIFNSSVISCKYALRLLVLFSLARVLFRLGVC